MLCIKTLLCIVYWFTTTSNISVISYLLSFHAVIKVAIGEVIREVIPSDIHPKTPQVCCKLSILPACCNLLRSAANLSILSNRNKLIKLKLVATCHLQTCCNLFKKLATNLWIKSLEHQLATSLLTTCTRLVVNKLLQAMQTHPDISLL